MFFISAAISLSPYSAWAHDWWMINNNSATCDNTNTTSPNFFSPLITKSFFQNNGYNVFVQEKRYTDGNLEFVELSLEPSNGAATTYLDFYPGLIDCQQALCAAKSDGSIADPNDLK